MNFWQQVIDGIEIVTMEVILAVAPIRDSICFDEYH